MFKKLRNLSVGNKINLGFSVNTIILAGAIIAVIILLKKFNTILDQVIHHRMVTVQKTHKLLNGVNESLAALRGWMLLGEEKFKKERHHVWKNEIIPSENNLEKLSEYWTDINNLKLFQTVKDDLVSFKKYQQDIEDIVYTPENLPAHKILFEKAAPLAKESIENINKISDLELSLEATAERKVLLVKLGNLEVTFSQILSTVESYLLSGDIKYKKRYDSLIATNDERLAELGSKIALFNKKQLAHFQKFERQRTRFKALTTETINLRESHEWNKANFYLSTKAAPLAKKIISKLEQMLISEKKILLDDELNAEYQIWILKILLAAFLIMGSFIAAIIGTSISKGIGEPIKNLNHGLKELTLGNRKLKELEVTSDNEIGELNKSFNKLLERVKLWQ